MKRPSPKQKPVPRCKAILVCQQVIVDRDSHQSSLINILDAFEVAAFPTELEPFYIYLQFAEGIGEYEMIVEIQNLNDDEVQARSPPTLIEFKDRLERLSLILRIESLSLSSAGAYDIVVYANNQEVDRQRFEVRHEGNDEEQNEI